MKPSILAIRSVGAEFANRVYFVVALIVSVCIVCLLGLSFWLTTFSDWWWLLVVVLIIVSSVAVGLLVIVKLIIRLVTPHQSPSQKKQTKVFVDKLQRLSDVAQTTKFMLLFHLVRDIAAPKENGFIASISSDSTTLKRDFIALVQTFK